MYRVIVADDEHHVVDWVVDLLSTNILDLDVHQTYNGLDVLEVAATRFFDIAVLDIRMPGMDGIATAKELIKRYPNIQIILLTGYDEFDLIYQVNHIPNIRYSLKTEADAEIISKVNDAIEIIEQTRSRQQFMGEAAMRKTLLQHYEQRSALLDLIYENQSSTSIPLQLEQYRTILQLDIQKPLHTALIQFTSKNIQRHYFSSERLFHLYRILETMIRPFFHFSMVDIQTTSALLLLQPETSCTGSQTTEILKAELDRSLQEYQRIYPDHIKYLVHDSPIPWTALFANIQLLTEALSHQRGHSQVHDGHPMILGSVFNRSFAVNQSSAPSEKTSIRTLFAKQLSQALASALYDHAPEQFYHIVTQITSEPHTVSGISKSEQAALRGKLSILVFDFINQYQLEEQIRKHISLSPLYRSMAATDWQAFLKYLVQLIQFITELSINEENNNSKLLVRAMKSYISNHLAQDLSVSNLAEVFNYNPSYISRLFKQIEGTTLSQYVKEARILEAKHLLRTSSLSVQNIANEVGFDTAQYFSMVFRKEVGVTPKTYRNSPSS